MKGVKLILVYGAALKTYQEYYSMIFKENNSFSHQLDLPAVYF